MNKRPDNKTKYKQAQKRITAEFLNDFEKATGSGVKKAPKKKTAQNCTKSPMPENGTMPPELFGGEAFNVEDFLQAVYANGMNGFGEDPGEQNENYRVATKSEEPFLTMKPRDIVAYLDEFIIGQESAKKTLAVAIYNHKKRLSDTTGLIRKSNILMAGPTGTGKTLLAQTIAKILDVPFTIADATSLTEAGYVGDDVENCLARLLQAAGGDPERAERGIIMIDEIDKIARKGENVSITRDVSGEGVQQALLKIIEGTIASVPPQGGRKHPHQETIQIDTSQILFICAGAFEGLVGKKKENIGLKQTIGFSTGEESDVKNQDADEFEEVTPEMLTRFGMLPELIGRLPVIVTLNDLDQEALVRILSEPRNAATKEYQALLAQDGIELVFEKEALEEIARLALEKKTGARGLRSIIEKLMLDVMYDLPSETGAEKCVITKQSVTDGKPTIIYRAA